MPKNMVNSADHGRRLRVLLLLHELAPTGAPRVAVSAMEQLMPFVDVRTVSLVGGALEERAARLGRVQVLTRRAWPGIDASASALAAFARERVLGFARGRLWAQTLKRWKPDVVYVNSVAGLLVTRRLPLPCAPVLLHVHELDSVLTAFARHSMFLLRDLPDAYIAVSEACKEALVRYGVDGDKVRVIHAFTDDVPPFSPADRAREYLLPTAERPLTVGGAGVVNWCKGAQLWLLTAAETARLLGRDRVRFQWLGVGETGEGWQFREMARKLGLNGIMDCVPFTPDTRPFFAAWDVFLLSSWEESASLVTLENMAGGTPCACFAGAGGPRELVGDVGLVLPTFDPMQMAQALCTLAEDPARRREWGERAAMRVRERFTASVQAPKILAVLGDMARQSQS